MARNYLIKMRQSHSKCSKFQWIFIRIISSQPCVKKILAVLWKYCGSLEISYVCVCVCVCVCMCVCVCVCVVFFMYVKDLTALLVAKFNWLRLTSSYSGVSFVKIGLSCWRSRSHWRLHSSLDHCLSYIFCAIDLLATTLGVLMYYY